MNNDILQIFLGKDNEPITEELISELVAQGIPEKDLRQLAEDGFTYCRARNSFISPPGYIGNLP